MAISAFLGLGPLFDLHLPNLDWIYKEIHRFFLTKCIEARKFEGTDEEAPKLDRPALETELLTLLSDKIYLHLGNDFTSGDLFDLGRAINFSDKTIKLGNPVHYIVDKAYPRILRLLLEHKGSAELAFHNFSPVLRAIGKFHGDKFPLDEPEVELIPPIVKKRDLVIHIQDCVTVVRVLHCFGADAGKIYPTIKNRLSPEMDEEFKRILRFSGRQGVADFFGIVSKCLGKGKQNALKELRDAVFNWNIGYLGQKYKDFDELRGLPFEMWFSLTAKAGSFKKSVESFSATDQTR